MTTQSTILAAGNTNATSTTVTVENAAEVKIGIFCATADAIAPPTAFFRVMELTPGADNYITSLTNRIRSINIRGPATVNVTRCDYTGAAFGVFKEV